MGVAGIGFEVMMKNPRKARAIVILALGLVGVSAFLYVLRYDFAQLILSFPPLEERINAKIYQALSKEIAARLRKKIDLNFFQKLEVALSGERNEKERQRDATEAVDRFIREELKKGNLGVMWVGRLKEVDPGAVKKNELIIKNHPLVLVWNGDSGGEIDVVAAFSLSLGNGLSVKEVEGNEKARFFERVSKIAEEAALGD
jgi:hypothetical protein